METLANFLHFGGIPEYHKQLMVSEKQADLFADSILRTIVEKDIFQRLNITNKHDFNKILDFILDSVGSYVSPRSISDTLRSHGTVVDKQTVAKYLDALCEAYLVYKVPRFEIKGKGLLQTLNKYYVVDPIFAKVRLKKAMLKDRSHWLENMVYLELVRRNKEVFIGKRDNLEVDFVVADHEDYTSYYQVAWTTEDSMVDRINLDSQTQNVFKEAPNVMPTEDIDTLNKFLENDARYIIITTIFKFKDAKPNINRRDNIIVMVDEAHRTQEGDLGQRMRAALPNAFFFGLTGTPINKSEHNTFWTFGALEDQGGYMSRYSFEDALHDNTILPLHFEPCLLDIHIDRDAVDEEFERLSNELDEDAKITLSSKAAKMLEFLKSPERIQIVCKDIAEHYRNKVEPQGFKAMIVTPDREACHLYKMELNNYFPDSASAVVISTSGKGEDELKRLYSLTKDEQEKVIEKFNKSDSELKFLIVTAKLLTGFDSPILQTMYLDKSLKDHTLLQAICRTNRKFPNKTFGRIVDYFGVFDDAAKALEFDEDVMKKVITNLNDLIGELPQAMADALSHFDGVDRTVDGFDGLQAVQEAINTNEKRDAFAADYRRLSNIWESLSPDPALEPYRADYKWLSNVYQSVKPSGPDALGKLIWLSLGAQTKKIMYENIHVSGIHTDMEEVILDETMVSALMGNKDMKAAKKMERELIKRFKKHADKPKFIELSKRLEALRDKAEQGLISSIEFIKELCQIARETLQAEKQEAEVEVRKTGKEALTELFLELRTEDTPAVVDRIVADIDSIVKVVRFPGWQTTNAGEREVQKALRKTLLKYKLHKEKALFQKAYMYIREYY